MSAFADTSGLYALLVETEEGHRPTVESFRRLVRGRGGISTTSYVLVETMALLQHRIGLPAVRDLVDRIVPLLSVEWASPALHRKGCERLFREDRRQLSFVNAVSLEYLRSAGLKDVLGLDRHFEEAGFRLLPRKGE